MIALLTGITGQTCSYLAELLLNSGYIVHGVIRRSSSFNTGRIDHIFKHPNLKLHYGDVTDGPRMMDLICQIKPDHIYNLAAMSHVMVSFDQPVYATDTIVMGNLNLLEAARRLNHDKEVRFYHAGSSEQFGSAPPPQNEDTKFHPRSPYACAKVCAYYQTINYREAYRLFACNGILHNHESSRRGETFLTRKVTRAATRIKLGLQDKLYLGNLDAKRDWGYAPDYAVAIQKMLLHNEPDDYVIATGESHTVREFVSEVFKYLGLDWGKYVETDLKYYRPSEVDHLEGDYSKAKKVLGWEPQVKFKDIIRIMVDADLELAKREKILSSLS